MQEKSQNITHELCTRSEKQRPKLIPTNKHYSFPFYLKVEVPITPHIYSVVDILAVECHREDKIGRAQLFPHDLRIIFSC